MGYHGCSVLESNLRLARFLRVGKGAKLDSDYSGSAASSPIFCSNLLVRSFFFFLQAICLCRIAHHQVRCYSPLGYLRVLGRHYVMTM